MGNTKLKKAIIDLLNSNIMSVTPYVGGEGLHVIDAEDLDSLSDEIIETISDDFETSSEPLIKHLNHIHPHVTAIVTTTSCELLEGIRAYPEKMEYILD